MNVTRGHVSHVRIYMPMWTECRAHPHEVQIHPSAGLPSGWAFVVRFRLNRTRYAETSWKTLEKTATTATQGLGGRVLGGWAYDPRQRSQGHYSRTVHTLASLSSERGF